MHVVTKLPFVDSLNRLPDYWVKHLLLRERRAEWLWWQREYLTF